MADVENLAAFADSARRALSDVSPLQAMRDHVCAPESLARQTWQTAVELGWTGLCVPESCGGLDTGIEFLCGLGVEIGRTLAAGPFAANLALAPALVSHLKDSAFKTTLLSSIVSGEAVLTDSCFIARNELSARLHVSAGQARVSSDDHIVDHAEVANHLLWLQVRPQDHVASLSCALIALNSSGVSREEIALFDPTSRGCKLSLRDVAVDAGRHMSFTMGLRELDWLFLPVRLFTAAQAVGVAQRVIEIAVEHACNRRQFGQPLGAFQAVKHQLANLHVESEKARLLMQYAARDFATGKPTLLDAHTAWLAATRAAINASQVCLQVHGAVGFSWEYPIHLFLKRARSLATKFVGVLESRRFIADTITQSGQLRGFDEPVHDAAQIEGV
jgi:acyl-CoA dehydrogenase